MLKRHHIKQLEGLVEGIIWNTRFLTFIPVIFGLISVICLFILGSWDILQGLYLILKLETDNSKLISKILGLIIGGIDLYFIGIVLLLFSFGIYELFISKIDIARQPNVEIKILEVQSLEELKDKIMKVIVIVLVVSFFKQVTQLELTTAGDLLYLAISILLLSASGYLMQITPISPYTTKVVENAAKSAAKRNVYNDYVDHF